MYERLGSFILQWLCLVLLATVIVGTAYSRARLNNAQAELINAQAQTILQQSLAIDALRRQLHAPETFPEPALLLGDRNPDSITDDWHLQPGKSN